MTALSDSIPAAPGPAAAGHGAERDGARLHLASGIGLGVSLTWLSLLVLIPLAAVVAKSFSGGWGQFWSAVSAPRAVATLLLTVACAAIVALINAVMGTAIAWVLVRDRFRGRRVLETIVDIPFALPTIVAGLVLISVYGPSSPIHLNLYGTRVAVALALLFVTLPFVVRAVQPVLLELDAETEQAAACLGAGPITIFRRVVLPQLLPVIASGAGLGFARALGEYGSVLLIGGGLAHTEVASLYTYGLIQSYDYTGAAAVSLVLLAVGFTVLLGLDSLRRRDGLRRRATRHG